MPIIVYKPTTSARRRTSIVSFSDITKSEPEKKLTITRKTFAGRNKSGKITVRHRGGSAKPRIKAIEFKKNKIK